jgi:hypothetical protein
VLQDHQGSLLTELDSLRIHHPELWSVLLNSHRAKFLGEFLKFQRIPQSRGAVVEAGGVVSLGKILLDNEDFAKAHVAAVLDGDRFQCLVLRISLVAAAQEEGAYGDNHRGARDGGRSVAWGVHRLPFF